MAPARAGRLALCALGLAALPATAAPALADSATDVGIFGAVLTGTHVGDGNAPESGVVPGAALELTERVDRVRLHLEGIPTVTAGSTTRGAYGGTSASLSLLNSTVSFDLDAHRYFRVGAGYQFITLTNKDGLTGQRNAVRVASPIYSFATTLPLRPNHFIEGQILVDPNVRGNLLDFDHTGASLPTAPEQGAEIDYGAAYGWNAGRVTYLAGVRALSYHTRNDNSGALVDRNVGAGVTFEARFHFGER
jgi:hypothetical protein